MGDVVSRIVDLMRGLVSLGMLAFRTRFRFSGPYWQWRLETAFGSDRRRWPPRRERLRAMLEYAEWVGRMKRYM